MSAEKLKRSHMCGNVNENLIGETITVSGWVSRRRSLGQLIFVLLRDRTGIVQGVIDEEKVDKELFEKVKAVRNEYVITFTGKVIERTEQNINPDMKTGKVEIEIEKFTVHSKADVPPFQVADEGVGEDLRLKYRYIDLRRPEMQRKLFTRHNITKNIREFLDSEGFTDIETPFLTRSTPEGARDYLVPSRIHNGDFYALPQSPQQLKQLLMISGFDKYYQIVKCFRDEDLRADRQPEFTQVDIEMSFIDVEDVIEVNNSLVKNLFKEIGNVDIELPIKRMEYTEAMERFGVDKPDIRFGMELIDISEIVKDTDFRVFKNPIESGGSVRAINANNCGGYTRKQIDSLIDYSKGYGAGGLAWIIVEEDGFRSSISNFFTDDELKEIADKMEAKENDLILICADNNDIVFSALGNLRNEIAKREEILNPNEYKAVWITDFPLLEWDEEDNRYYAMHHPFTKPKDEDYHLLKTDPAKVRADAYDIVINGYEVGGGSIRINDKQMQEEMLEVLGFTEEMAEESFGYLLEAFKYGVPPHGGIAYGLDRLAMLLTHTDNIRDVIAFPKTQDASCLLTNAPNLVSKEQLDELGLEIKKKK